MLAIPALRRLTQYYLEFEVHLGYTVNSVSKKEYSGVLRWFILRTVLGTHIVGDNLHKLYSASVCTIPHSQT